MLRNLDRNKLDKISKEQGLIFSIESDDWTAYRQMDSFYLFVHQDDHNRGDHIDNGYIDGAATVWLSNNIQEGYKVLDYGAGNGYFSILMSYLVGDNGVVVAFDINQINQKLIKKSIVANDITNIEIQNPACEMPDYDYDFIRAGAGTSPLVLETMLHKYPKAVIFFEFNPRRYKINADIEIRQLLASRNLYQLTSIGTKVPLTQRVLDIMSIRSTIIAEPS
jgi:SAM-dependent methyltransferase